MAAQAEKGRETAERFEEHVKDLIDKLAKEAGPVGEELRKILERSIDEIHETLKKDGVTTEDVRKALEKSHNEMRKGLEKGGSVNKEFRGAVDKSRRDLQQEWERARSDLRMAMRDRVQRQRERTEDAEKGAEKAKDAPTKDAADIEKERAELEKARAEVRTLQQQLQQANRRLGELQRRARWCAAVVAVVAVLGDAAGMCHPLASHRRTTNLRTVARRARVPRDRQMHPFLRWLRAALCLLPHHGGPKLSETENAHPAASPTTTGVCGTSITSSKNCSRRSRSSRTNRSRRRPRARPLVVLELPAQALPSRSEVDSSIIESRPFQQGGPRAAMVRPVSSMTPVFRVSGPAGFSLSSRSYLVTSGGSYRPNLVQARFRA